MTEPSTVTSMPPAPPRTRVRPEIQALRAAAVMAVVLFHLWPGAVPGGYAGVDIFFVISGFLITSHLAREVARTGHVRLSRFWARRVRRLLPAALLVLGVVTVATYAWVPKTLWPQHLWEIVASATYWENWRLAGAAVDYLAAEEAPTASQHYWSLSVEEQFYIIWPLLLIAALAIAKARARGTTVFAVVLATLFVGSLVSSIVLTNTDPAAAYFVTPTRIFEFAAGGLLALAAPEPNDLTWSRLRIAVRWAGWAALAATVLLYTPRTAFPGYAALLPVLGTVAVIWAGPARRRSTFGYLTQNRLAQWVGDISYSVYLWHWPPIVILPFVIGGDLGLGWKLAILAASLGLGALTKRWVEDPVRSSPTLMSRTTLTFGLGAAAMAIVVLAAAWGIAMSARSAAESTELTDRYIASGSECLGADYFLNERQPCFNPELQTVLLPELTAVKSDTGNAYSCYDKEPGAELQTCTYGSTKPDALRVALVGNSHAAQLLPGLWEHLEERNWTLDTYVGRGCGWSDPFPEDPCTEHRVALQERFEQEDYDLIIVAERRSLDVLAGEPNPVAQAQADAWAPVIAEGTRVVALTDNPLLTPEALECITVAHDRASASSCTMTEAEAWRTADSLPEAVELAGDGAYLVDLSPAYCQDDVCPVVLGSVVAYRDQSHLTATFVRTLVPFMLAEMDRLAVVTS